MKTSPASEAPDSNDGLPYGAGEKNNFMRTTAAFVLFVGSLASSLAATTINPTNKYAYGANIGWIDWRGDTNNGAVIGEYVCSGFIYSANVGWINLGSGSPA